MVLSGPKLGRGICSCDGEIELAKIENTPVLFTAAEIPVEIADSGQVVPTEPVVAVLVQAPIMAIKPSGEEVQLAEVVTAPTPTLN